MTKTVGKCNLVKYKDEFMWFVESSIASKE